MRCPHSAVCHISMGSNIGPIEYGHPCNLAASGPEPCPTTSKKLGLDPESGNTWPKESWNSSSMEVFAPTLFPEYLTLKRCP